MSAFLILLACTLFLMVQGFEVQRAPAPCQVMLHCPKTGEITFASEGKTCYVFRNSCHLRNENCRRHNVFFRTLHPISVVDCRSKCNAYCKPQGIKLCISSEGHFMTVNSNCEWNKIMCETGKYWNFIYGNACLDDFN